MGFYVPDNLVRDNMKFILGYTEKEIKAGNMKNDEGYVYLDVLKKVFRDILVSSEYIPTDVAAEQEKDRSERRRMLRGNISTGRPYAG